MLMPSVVERVFRPRRNMVLDHYLDAYTAAIDALMARHEHQLDDSYVVHGSSQAGDDR